MLVYFLEISFSNRHQTDSVNFIIPHHYRYHRWTMTWSISHHVIKIIHQQWVQRIMNDKVIHHHITVHHMPVIESLMMLKVNWIDSLFFQLTNGSQFYNKISNIHKKSKEFSVSFLDLNSSKGLCTFAYGLCKIHPNNRTNHYIYRQLFEWVSMIKYIEIGMITIE